MISMNAMAAMISSKPSVQQESASSATRSESPKNDFLSTLKQAVQSGDQAAVKEVLAKVSETNDMALQDLDLKEMMAELVKVFEALLAELDEEDVSGWLETFLSDWEELLPDGWLEEVQAYEDLTLEQVMSLFVELSDELTLTKDNEAPKAEPDPLMLLMMLELLRNQDAEEISEEALGYLSQAEGLLASMTQVMLPEVKPDQQMNLDQMRRNWMNFFERTVQAPEQVNQQGQSRFQEFAFLKELFARTNGSSQSNQQMPSMLLDTNNAQLARFQMMMGASLTQQAQPERASQEAFIRQFQNLLSKSSFQQLSNGIQQMSIKLHPQSLGRLDIQVQMVNGALVARMMTSTSATRDLLDGQLQSLRAAFQSQNIQVDRIEVTQQQSQSLFRDPKDDETNQQAFTDDNQDKDDQDEQEEVLDFSDLLEVSIDEEV
ncbi:flagellar hook-length control protein FliK [Salisediminibacterium selenitireducens]|uniref:Flagellar hook-length control protein n=1 Tax=Bacillus selenitireducens (strain ATCC 700615 / DSM 15326 / MLS10) TaxID=439292 RepID=D6XTW9_BACIE|nr:flagellar hook-length control protein FliK [Salisediminibacterium selenitireducens]ADH99255.1 flagellar hook-length control protein [[Bacillus] selenitireducens MLS10]